MEQTNQTKLADRVSSLGHRQETSSDKPTDAIFVFDRDGLVGLAGHQAGDYVSIVQNDGVHLVVVSDAGAGEDDRFEKRSAAQLAADFRQVGTDFFPAAIHLVALAARRFVFKQHSSTIQVAPSPG